MRTLSRPYSSEHRRQPAFFAGARLTSGSRPLGRTPGRARSIRNDSRGSHVRSHHRRHFPLGGILIDWNPHHLYRKLFGADEAAMEAFLARVCTPEWNARLDAGRPFAEAVEELVAA